MIYGDGNVGESGGRGRDLMGGLGAPRGNKGSRLVFRGIIENVLIAHKWEKEVEITKISLT